MASEIITATEFWAAVAVAVPLAVVMIGVGFGLGEMAWRIDRTGRRWGLLAALAAAIPLSVAAVAVVVFWVPHP